MIYHSTQKYRPSASCSPVIPPVMEGVRETYHSKLPLKDPASAITHLIAMLAAICFTPFLLVRALWSPLPYAVVSMSLFMVSMILLYGASTLYHSLNLSDKGNLLLRRLDHSMIFVLIAGSYTPVCLLCLPGRLGLPLLALIWGLAAVGILVTIVLIGCPRWVSSVIYIAMGWTCILVFRPLFSVLTRAGFLWLLTGGIIYTLGGIIYGLKLKIFRHLPRGFGSHEIFHLFVMGGSICHYIFMCFYVL